MSGNATNQELVRICTLRMDKEDGKAYVFEMQRDLGKPSMNILPRWNMTFAWALLILLAGLIWVALDQTQLISPASENESAFLKTYTPAKVIDRFKSAQFSQESVGTTSGAGREFATHEADFEPTFVINAGDWVALMDALRDDITSRLAEQGGEIVDESGNAADGFQIEYAIGKSQGTVAVGPLTSVAASSLISVGPAKDKATVKLRIRVDEKWFKIEGQAERKRASSYNLRFGEMKLFDAVIQSVPAT
jgi:hypothetical protein